MKFLKGNTPYNCTCLDLNNEWKAIHSLKKKYFSFIKLLIELIMACIYAFGLGYNLFYLDRVLKTGLIFLVLLVVSYLFIIIPHEFLHVLCYKTKDNVIIRYSLIKLKLVSYFDGTISKSRALVLIILPFIVFTIIPTVASYLLGFNLFLYALASANSIKYGVDLLNFIFVIKNVPQNGNLIVNEYDFYFKSESINE